MAGDKTIKKLGEVYGNIFFSSLFNLRIPRWLIEKKEQEDESKFEGTKNEE